MDSVCIEDLRLDALIGVYPWEREIRQPLLLSCVLGCRDRLAADALAGGIDYAQVAAALRTHVAERADGLLETLAESCCAMLAARFAPISIDLRIDKPMAALALGCARVGVRVQRQYA